MSDTNDPRRNLPSVNELVDEVAAGTSDAPRRVITVAARDVLDETRKALSNGSAATVAVTPDALADQVRISLASLGTHRLRSVINATGILLHTGLGRAPLADAAINAMTAAARNAAVEINLSDGHRGHRTDFVKPLLCELTGAQSAAVVNNCTAALVLMLSAFGRHRSVLVSRGELIEIGGSFRLPEIIAAAGVNLREVGTTNKTRLSDYERAMDDDVGAILKAHASNYRIEGFTQEPSVAELSALARANDVPFMHDIGSGAIGADSVPLARHDEPTAVDSIREGADLVTFSGDKLLGGPQCGIIVGRADMIAELDQHPLKRALRVDKLILASLAATLELHLDEARRNSQLPLFVMSKVPLDALRTRAVVIAEQLRSINADVRIESSHAYLGGGTLPGEQMDSIALVVKPRALSANDLATQLRNGKKPVVARIADDALWFDLRTIRSDDDETVALCIIAAISS